MRGTIEKIFHDQNDRGECWTLLIGGQRFSVFNKALIQDLSEGDSVDFFWTGTGQYKRIVKLSKGGEKKDTGVQIARMSAIRSAAELVSACSLAPGEKAKTTLEIAQQFESHILR